MCPWFSRRARWDRGPAYRGTLTLGEAMDILNSGRGARLTPTQLDAYDDWVRNTVLQLRGIDTYQEFIKRHQAAMEGGESD